MVPTVWPKWWEWELRLSHHLQLRMAERDLDEVDLRELMEAAAGFTPGAREGRFLIYTIRRRRRWIIVVEPDWEVSRLVVVTALPDGVES